MKNKLLITTALVAAFAAADVCAADRIIVEDGGAISNAGDITIDG